MGKPCFISMPATQAIQQFHKVYISKLEQLVKTTVLTLSKTKDLVNSLHKSVSVYQENHDFARLVGYEDNERVSTIRLLLFLMEHKNDYIMDKSFNENLKTLYKVEDTLTVTADEKIEYLKYLLTLHEKGLLLNIITDSINFFDIIYANEKGT